MRLLAATILPLLFASCRSACPFGAARDLLLPQTSELAVPSSPELENDEELLNLLAGAFDLAREGATTQLGALLVPEFPVDIKNARGDTLLILATYYGHEQTVRLLLESGASIEAGNDAGQTALMGAAFRGDAEVTSLLLEHGADPNGTSLDGRTALHFAALFGNAQALSLLIDAGANPALADASGIDALQLARSQGNQLIEAELLAALRPWNNQSSTDEQHFKKERQ